MHFLCLPLLGVQTDTFIFGHQCPNAVDVLRFVLLMTHLFLYVCAKNYRFLKSSSVYFLCVVKLDPVTCAQAVFFAIF